MKRGRSRATATLAVSLRLIGVIGGFVWLTWSSLSDQVQYVTGHFQELQQQAMRVLPGWAREAVGAGSASQLESRIAPYALRLAQSAAAAAVVAVLGFILTMYLLLEGRGTRDWLVAFVPVNRRAKVEQTLEECQRVVFAYVAGNIATSIFATIFVFVSMSILRNSMKRSNC